MHGRRVGERQYQTTLREEMYLREHWPLLRALRVALRTEPNVRLALLFGSVAMGRASERSDLDLLVVLGDQAAGAVAALAQRLSDRVDREVQLVRLQEAERSPGLMADALAQGRVLVDRDGAWPALKAAERRWQREAAAEAAPLLESAPDLGLSWMPSVPARTSTSTRSRPPTTPRTRPSSTTSKRSNAASISSTTASPSCPHLDSSWRKFISFYDAYRTWIGRGFSPTPPP